MASPTTGRRAEMNNLGSIATKSQYCTLSRHESGNTE
jgi:hypothetical protein